MAAYGSASGYSRQQMLNARQHAQDALAWLEVNHEEWASLKLACYEAAEEGRRLSSRAVLDVCKSLKPSALPAIAPIMRLLHPQAARGLAQRHTACDVAVFKLLDL